MCHVLELVSGMKKNYTKVANQAGDGHGALQTSLWEEFDQHSVISYRRNCSDCMRQGDMSVFPYECTTAAGTVTSPTS